MSTQTIQKRRGPTRHLRELAERIERRYGLGMAECADGRPYDQGDPITIAVDLAIDDLDYVVARMFASDEPFHLWGLPQQVAEQHYRIHAVDLLAGDTLAFDITPKHMVIQLPKGASGNSIVRFVRSLQNHVNFDVGSDILN